MPNCRILAPLLLLITATLAGCLSVPVDDRDLAKTPDAVPRLEERTRKGNPPSYNVSGIRYVTLKTERGFVERGIASWYGPNFHGEKTSNGEKYNMYAMTAAHTRLPIPSYVRVTNLKNGKSAVVRINDRGPFKDNRVIDLSKAAAAKVGIIAKGTGLVEVRAIVPGEIEQPIPAYAPIKGEIYLQAGAFGDPRNAEQLKKELTQLLDHPVQVRQEEQEGVLFYKVLTGPYRDVDETDRQAARLAALGKSSFVVIN